MDKVKAIAIIAFIAAIGLLLMFLGCGLSEYNWWPTFVIIFYILGPVPLLVWSRFHEKFPLNKHMTYDFAIFLTSVIAGSSFGLPIILANNPINSPVVSFFSS